MDHDPNIFRDSSQVIQEVEDQLERILQKKFRDVDSELIERINREKEAARKRKEEIERDFEKEKTSLADYRIMVRDFEEQRAGLLNEARERFQKVLKFQAEIESLAKSTVDEIKRVNDIQERLEVLRTKTSDRAAFLKNDLQERFGIVAEVLPEEPIPELIAGPAAAEPAQAPVEEVAKPAAEAIALVPESLPEPLPEPPPVPEVQTGEAATEEEAVACIEGYRRIEPANGSGEIHYFQRGDVAIADPEKLLATVDRTLEEGQRLSFKLGQTESPKDQFFIKQELINWQEGLRALFLRVIKMVEKDAWTLPRFTEEIVNAQVLRRLLERLSMENWSNLEEFASFAVSVDEIRKAFKARTEPRLAYLLALKREIESE